MTKFDCIIIHYKISCFPSVNGHFLQFGQEAQAASVNYYYDKYTVGTEWYLDQSHETSPVLIHPIYGYDTSQVCWDGNDYSNYFDYTIYGPLRVNSSTGYVNFTIGDSYRPTDGLKYGDYFYTRTLYRTTDGTLVSNDLREPFRPGEIIYRYMFSYSSHPYAYGYYAGYSQSLQREVKNTLLQSNLIAPDGTYPDDGVHTDGYWYVKKGIANQNPTINIISPSQNGTLRSYYYMNKEVA